MTSRAYFVWAGLIAVVVASFTAGVRLGAELGVEEFGRMDSSAKASVLAYELKALRGLGEPSPELKAALEVPYAP